MKNLGLDGNSLDKHDSDEEVFQSGRKGWSLYTRFIMQIDDTAFNFFLKYYKEDIYIDLKDAIQKYENATDDALIDVIIEKLNQNLLNSEELRDLCEKAAAQPKLKGSFEDCLLISKLTLNLSLKVTNSLAIREAIKVVRKMSYK